MIHTVNKTKGILLTVMTIPLLSVFMLTIVCSLDEFVLNCCTDPAAELADHQDHPTPHHAHGPDIPASHTHSGTTQDSPEGHHSGDDDDCCNDLTTAFFSVFQVQPHTFVADQPVPVDHHPVIVVKNIFNSYVVDPSLIYPGFDTPMKIAFTGRHLRILYQSFLN